MSNNLNQHIQEPTRKGLRARPTVNGGIGVEPAVQQPMRYRRVLGGLVATVLLLGTTASASNAATSHLVAKKTTKKAVASFTVKMLTPSARVTAGNEVVLRFVVSRTGGFKKAISFDVPDLPENSTAVFTKQSTSVYQLRIRTSAQSLAGTSSYVVRAQSGSIERIAIFSLTLTAPATTVPANPTTAPPVTKVGDFTLSTTVQSKTILPGEVASYTIVVNRRDYSGPVTFRTEGAPAGARADAAPNPTMLGTTLYITTSTTTPSGNYLVVVTGTGGGITHSIAVRVVVRRVGPFVLSLSPAQATVNAGQDTSTQVTIGRTAGSTTLPEVDLALLDAPAGVQIRTAVTQGATTQLVISTATTTAAGTYKIIVSGTSGTYKQGLQFTLTVTRDLPGFGISVTPTSATVQQGAITSFDLRITPVGGFSDPVAISVSGLPAGATSTIETVQGGVIVKIATAKSTPATTYPVTLSATSGSKVATVEVKLVVVAAAV